MSGMEKIIIEYPFTNSLHSIRFFDWIFTKYFEERNLEVRSLLMKAIYYVSSRAAYYASNIFDRVILKYFLYRCYKPIKIMFWLISPQ
jgi:hypothetical protein